jgi:uroporphyrinogen-III synthase
MSNVILLKAPSKDSPDRYESSFKVLGHHVVSVPVLETVLTHLDELASIVETGPITPEYDGVIITSGRACEGWRRAVNDLLVQPCSGQGRWCIRSPLGLSVQLDVQPTGH